MNHSAMRTQENAERDVYRVSVNLSSRRPVHGLNAMAIFRQLFVTGALLNCVFAAPTL